MLLQDFRFRDIAAFVVARMIIATVPSSLFGLQLGVAPGMMKDDRIVMLVIALLLEHHFFRGNYSSVLTNLTCHNILSSTIVYQKLQSYSQADHEVSDIHKVGILG